MKSDKGFHMDFSKFEEDFKRITEKAVPTAAGKGLFYAGNELLNDAIYKPPQAPYEFGDLWASAKTEGNGIMHELKAGISSSAKATETQNEIAVMPGFDIEYAARWHEVPKGRAKNINWTRTGAKQPGRKYLETKMHQFKNKYMYTVASTIKRSAK